LGFRRGSVVADLVSGATVASIPALHLAGRLEYWHIVVLVFILASVNSQGDTARLALVPALARRAHMPFERVNARDRAIFRLGAVLGPFLAGILITEVGAVNVLFVDAATFSISALLVVAGVPRSVDARERRPVEGGGRRYLAELADGLRPPQLLGRVFGALTAIAQAAIPIGAVVVGVAVQQAGLIPTIVGMGVVYVVVTIGMFFNPALRGMDVRRGPVAEPTDVPAAAHAGQPIVTSRTTDIH
jgi:MFS family permease